MRVLFASIFLGKNCQELLECLSLCDLFQDRSDSGQCLLCGALILADDGLAVFGYAIREVGVDEALEGFIKEVGFVGCFDGAIAL